MPGVMDINHLLCRPMINKSDCNYQHTLLSSEMPSPTHAFSQQHYYVLPLPANFDNVEFWQHNRSMSTASIASNTSTCTTNSNYSSSMNSFITTDQPQKYRRRVSSESDTKFIAYSNHQQQRQKPATTKRIRANSVSYIQTRTPWTPAEDDLLQKGYQQGLSWAMISCTFLPHRSRGCCWGRFKTLQSKNAIEVYQQRICQRPWKAHYKK
ncbi:54S ribosomal protein L7, mitochondrial [Mucor velutinosus]|uniref:54S ribosomal protein L7, mitochondrial n=1 Tax=Mucor velutinosus TaxID=708070 RepID=A0AAN7DEF3_9FUNG|nr:54S ribosomal protein L7, mitochondrial [Mucor velutinosus]